LAPNGEVEDYEVLTGAKDNQGYDWGDLPETKYKTVLVSDGPYHQIFNTPAKTVRMGETVDSELNGQPSLNANGDDLNGVPDDEDGVTAANLTSMPRGGSRVVNVSVFNNSGSPATLWAWIDFNADGIVDVANETRTTTVPSSGSQQFVQLTFNVPSGAADSTYARFRIGTNAGQVSQANGAASDGEVEDYVVTTSTPTGARLAYFNALAAGAGGVQLGWGTLVENGVLGFHVNRATADGGWQRVTAEMIVATGWDGRPQNYGVVDRIAPALPGVGYQLVGVDPIGQEFVLAEAAVQAGMTAGISATSDGLSLTLRGAPNAQVSVEMAAAVTGPWAVIQRITLDGNGTATLNLGRDYHAAAQFYRVLTE
jgi:hypothetical protein